MKTVLLLLVQLLSINLYSQEISLEQLKSIGLPYDEVTKKVTFTNVVEAPNINKVKLFSLVRSELAFSLANNKMVTLLEDSALGRLVVQGTFDLVIKRGNNNKFHNIIFTLIIETKDNKFKYILTDYIVYNAEAPIAKSTSISWIDGISTTKLKEQKLKLYPFEEFFSHAGYREDKAKIFPSFKIVNSELISRLEEVPKSSSADW